MDYVELKLRLNPFSQELAEILMSDLGDLGFDSFSEADQGFNAYIPVNYYQRQNVDDLVFSDKSQADISIEEQTIKAQNWNAVWESNFEPIVVDNRCVIRAPFHHNCPTLEYNVIVEPKMSFGTGHHDTTYLMAQWLLNANVKEFSVLDMGCGTGILAIVAAMKGAAHVDAIDIDEWSYENAIENVKTNAVEAKVTVMQGDASLLVSGAYDLILANINRNILLQDMLAYTSVLKSGGTLVMSGIFTEDIPTIESEAVKCGLRKIGEQSRNQWARVVFGR